MCGEIKAWQHAHVVVVRMTNPATLVNNTSGSAYLSPVNSASVNVPLNQLLEQIEEVRLDEYDVERQAIGGSTSNMWRISFRRSNLEGSVTCSASGDGLPFNVNQDVVTTHHIYDRPRTMSLTPKSGGLNTISIDVVDEFGAPVIFKSMTFYLTFVMRKPNWDPAQVMRNDANLLEWWRSNLNVGRMIV